MSEEVTTKNLEMQLKAEAAVEKMSHVRALRKISGNARWTLLQDIMQEIVATYVVADPESVPSAPKLLDTLVQEVKNRYPEGDETRELLLNAVPSVIAIRSWFKADGWKDAVWEKARVDKLFTPERRAGVINALHQKAVKGDTSAAKLYLTMSGDYVEKSETTSKNETVEKFREINQILHKKNG